MYTIVYVCMKHNVGYIYIMANIHCQNYILLLNIPFCDIDIDRISSFRMTSTRMRRSCSII